ncbi:integrase [Halobacteriales archaeon QS_8_69_26]|nr:MAG: integrase [Halobacteriales archaeon QS_8_69_26]
MSDDLKPLSPDEGVERFLEHRKPSIRESSYRNAVTRLNHFLEWCRENDVEDLNDLDGRDVADFVAWRRSQVAPITLQKQLSTIRVALRYWADLEAVEQGLAEKVHTPELPDGAESKDVQLPEDRANQVLRELGRYEYASRRHTSLALLWRTGMRTGALRSLDLEDFHPDDNAVELVHRPETGTPLKNGEHGERWVYLGPRWTEVVEEYLAANRPETTDEHRRQPLITTRYGRASGTTLQKDVYRATRPCEYRDCPHDRDPETCEAVGQDDVPSKCPSSRSPHAVRRGAITHHLNREVPPETVSERADVSLETLYRHYDARTEREKMNVRKQHLPEK